MLKRQCNSDVNGVKNNTSKTSSEITRNTCQGRCRVEYWQVTSVIAGFITSLLFGGIGNCYGVLYTYIQEPLAVSQYQLSWIGSVLAGFQGLASLLAAVLIDSHGNRTTVLIGSVLSAPGFIISSQTSNIYILYFTLGVMPGLGNGLSLTSSTVHVSQQFGRYRALAVALSVAGMSVGMLLWPPLVSGIADIMGWRGAVLINGGLLLHLVLCALLIKPKSHAVKKETPEVQQRVISSAAGGHTQIHQSMRNFLQMFMSTRILIIALVYFFSGLNYYTFSNFIPVYVTTSKPDIARTDVAWIISLSGFGNLAGRVVFTVTSMIHTDAPQYLSLLSLTVSGIANIIVPFCGDKLSQFVNGVFYGFAFGGYTSLGPVVLANVYGIENLSKTFGTSLFFSGIGSLCGPPLQSYFASLFDKQELVFYIAGGTYLISAISALPWVIKRPTERKIGPAAGTNNDAFVAEDSASGMRCSWSQRNPGSFSHHYETAAQIS